MSMQDRLEKEVESIEQDAEDGEITQAQANKEIQELERDYRNATEESAQDAYDDELESW